MQQSSERVKLFERGTGNYFFVKFRFCLRVSFAMCLKHVCQRKRNDCFILHVLSCVRESLNNLRNGVLQMSSSCRRLWPGKSLSHRMRGLWLTVQRGRHAGSPTGGSETPWIEIADAVQYLEPQPSTEGLEVKAFLPNGVSSLAMWGRTKFAFGKFEREITRRSLKRTQAMLLGVASI